MNNKIITTNTLKLFKEKYDKIVLNQIPDLSIYSPEENEILQYIGETTDKYINGYIYKAIKQEDDTFVYNPVNQILTKDIKSTIEIGGVEEDYVFKAGTSYEDIFTKLFCKYITPSVTVTTNFENNLYSEGENVNATFKIVVKEKSAKPTKIRISANFATIQTLEINGAGTYNVTVENITESKNFSIMVFDENNKVTTVSKVIKFITNAIYLGVLPDEITTPTQEDLFTLTKISQDTKEYEAVVNFEETYGRLTYAYPSEYGELISFKMEGFDYIGSSMSKKTITVNGNEYYCYMLNDSAGMSGNYKLEIR